MRVHRAPGDVGDFDLLAHSSAGLVEKLDEVSFTIDHELFTTLVTGIEWRRR